MLLAIDIGNTSIFVGAFSGSELRATWRWSAESGRLADEYGALLGWSMARADLDPSEVTGTVISSVVPSLTAVFQELCKKYLNRSAVVVDSEITTGLTLLVDNPKEVGADRIANAVAALRNYGAPCIVVDFGTATNFDVISDKGEFLGGAFAPGIWASMEGLYRHAAKLPQVELVAPPAAIGKNTIECVQSGVIFGYVGLVEGLVSRIQRELNARAKVVATGGLAEMMARYTQVFDKVDPFLTVQGLRLIYELTTGRCHD